MARAAEQPRVGVIGVGDISDWHVRALRIAGCAVTAVTTRRGSVRLRPFASRYGISRVYDDWQTMLGQPGEWDALVIATNPDGTPKILASALELNVPILVEKPVAWESRTLQLLDELAHDRVIVGFNRRFYRTVELARAEVHSGPPLLATLALPDAVNESETSKHYLRPFFDMSSHGLDLLRYIFGDIKITSVQRLYSKNQRPNGFAATLTSKRNDVVQIIGNWRAPANYALTLHRPDRRFEMLPLEVATIYEGMDVAEPTDMFPVRRYLPRVAERIFLDEIDQREKPGFVAQARALVGLIYGEPLSSRAATLADALAALRLCEELAGAKEPDVR